LSQKRPLQISHLRVSSLPLWQIYTFLHPSHDLPGKHTGCNKQRSRLLDLSTASDHSNQRICPCCRQGQAFQTMVLAMTCEGKAGTDHRAIAHLHVRDTHGRAALVTLCSPFELCAARVQQIFAGSVSQTARQRTFQRVAECLSITLQARPHCRLACGVAAAVHTTKQLRHTRQRERRQSEIRCK